MPLFQFDCSVIFLLLFCNGFVFDAAGRDGAHPVGCTHGTQALVTFAGVLLSVLFTE